MSIINRMKKDLLDLRDNKLKIYVIGFSVLFLTSIYVFSKSHEASEVEVETVKNEELKGGSLVDTESIRYYREKDKRNRRFNQEIVKGQKELMEQMAKIQERVQTFEKIKDSPPDNTPLGQDSKKM